MKSLTKFWVHVMAAAALVAASSPALSNDAAFGLSWGQAADALRARGVDLKQTKRESPFTIYTASRLPTGISIAETYSLIIHDQHGLQKLSMASTDFKSDPFGTQGKKVYADYKAALLEKYGSASEEHSQEVVGLRLFKERDEFYQCLRHPGCGMWTTMWVLPNTATISIELKGGSRDAGWLNLVYEGPRWAESVDSHKARRSVEDKKGL